ncbi:MAG: ATP-binding cassette domain-containing protein [Comamonadaceae bacterium]|nr:ATP-binding cassette domain-containing protein [Burkholderiales bacterium]MEB2349310.1 ATP-binding cassette domain-containing protein [Comamonadaceae bacterium]
MSGPIERNALQVQALSHAFGPRDVLQDIDLRVDAGRTVALVGPSGSGKSTLLHLCAGLLAVREGRVDNGFARTVMLFQQPYLLPWKTVLQNIALGLKARGVARAARRAQARAMGLAMGLDDLALAQFPPQLSGGMQSRAALARALVLEPDLLLLDEPFSALDIGLRDQMHRLLLAEQQRRALAVLLITHDLMEAVALAGSILVLAGSPARICWKLDLSVPAAERTDDWIHRQTALLLAQPVVRAAFELPAQRAARAGDAAAPAVADGLLSTGSPVVTQHMESERCEVLL